jgi:hypothetical protein
MGAEQATARSADELALALRYPLIGLSTRGGDTDGMSRRSRIGLDLLFSASPEKRLLQIGVQSQQMAAHRGLRLAAIVSANRVDDVRVLLVGDAKPVDVARQGPWLPPRARQADAIDDVKRHQ